MQQFPGIDFRRSPSGRHPHVTGTSLTVWAVYHLWVDHERDVEALLGNYPHLDAAKVQRAVAYVGEHLHEIPRGAFGTRPPFATVVEV